jgi:hypothetical protein
MNDSSKRRVGRPRSARQTGPLVLEGGRACVRLELEIAEKTAQELNEYARWVELSSTVGAKDALYRTVDFALRDVFRRDRLWQERRKGGERGDSPILPQSFPVAAAAPPPSPLPAPIPRIGLPTSTTGSASPTRSPSAGTSPPRTPQ